WVQASCCPSYAPPLHAGHISTVAGIVSLGTPRHRSPAPFPYTTLFRSVAVDGAGNLVIADTGSNRVRVVAAGTGTFYGQAMTEGNIEKGNGDGKCGFSGDVGPATAAKLASPDQTAVDSGGNRGTADGAEGRGRARPGG